MPVDSKWDTIILVVDSFTMQPHYQWPFPIGRGVKGGKGNTPGYQGIRHIIQSRMFNGESIGVLTYMNCGGDTFIDTFFDVPADPAHAKIPTGILTIPESTIVDTSGDDSTLLDEPPVLIS